MQLERSHIKQLKKETEKVHPVEACALLFGELSQDKVTVKEVTFTPNKLQSTVKFEVDPVDAVVAFAAAEKRGLEFIGLFHSHPAPAKPSSLDIKSMKLWGDAVWLILSTSDDNLAAYQLIDEEVKQVTIKIG